MRRFHRRRAKVGEFAHPFGAKWRPSASGWEYRANPSAASGLPSKVPNDAMVSTHKTLVVSNEGRVSTYKTSIVPNEGTVSTRKTLIVPHEGMVLTRKTLIVPHEGTVLIHKSPIMPNEGTVFCLLIFGE